jgi:hypothetical protein
MHCAQEPMNFMHQKFLARFVLPRRNLHSTGRHPEEHRKIEELAYWDPIISHISGDITLTSTYFPSGRFLQISTIALTIPHAFAN